MYVSALIYVASQPSISSHLTLQRCPSFFVVCACPLLLPSFLPQSVTYLVGKARLSARVTRVSAAIDCTQYTCPDCLAGVFRVRTNEIKIWFKV